MAAGDSTYKGYFPLPGIAFELWEVELNAETKVTVTPRCLKHVRYAFISELESGGAATGNNATCFAAVTSAATAVEAYTHAGITAGKKVIMQLWGDYDPAP